MDLHSVRHRRSFLSPLNDFRNLYRRYQILLQRRQRGIGSDLISRIAALIVTAGKTQPGDRNKEKGHAGPLHRLSNFDMADHVLAPMRWRFAKAEPAQALSI